MRFFYKFETKLMLKIWMKTALQIILAKIIGALAFHPSYASESGDEFCQIMDKRYGS
jgi:hypothetical protein